MVAIEDRFIPNADGLQLHVRLYGEPTDAVPVICLPGLTRNVLDFDRLARLLASPPHSFHVVSLSSRGRGLSDHDPDPSRYTVANEAADVLGVMQALRIEKAAFIGTSRGGLILHVLALTAPERIDRAVLNDIGPALEVDGLKQIQEALKKRNAQKDLGTAAKALRHAYGTEFPRLAQGDWAEMAEALFLEQEGLLVSAYDTAIGDQFRDMDLDTPLPALWEAFDALATRPLMVIRGEHSRLLSRETVKEMARRQPKMAIVEAQGQGHAPLLHLDDLPKEIAQFLLR
ncbi:alpha/beta fold hydrolase [Peteryoungia ipomoeae]|uniref:Alpha/beta hydrolase n=1 Tax=Peteryoungia ipomoeae TaxID=1210932 RepID=A0A4S8PC51_9HYPH|nr:alpha/beta hydrolase [Peteryoungia ipomoeae]THV25749.1 alpha/beta hydrolase [Peteryoungia ipomoeae]